jgi:hypothetical protein
VFDYIEITPDQWLIGVGKQAGVLTSFVTFVTIWAQSSYNILNSQGIMERSGVGLPLQRQSTRLKIALTQIQIKFALNITRV